MADVNFLLQNSSYQDSHDGGNGYSDYCRYDTSMGDQVNPDELLSPLERMKKYCDSDNIFTRQMVAKSVLETMHAITSEEDCHKLLQIISHLADDIEPTVRTELIEQIPSLALAIQDSNLIPDALSSYLLPIVLRYLNDANNQVRRLNQTALLHLLEQNLIPREDLEQQVCAVLLRLTELGSADDLRTEAVTLLTKLIPVLEAEATERLILERFRSLCADPLLHIRKACASSMGETAAVLGTEITETVLLPLFSRLCYDGVWGVRKFCAETFMTFSTACSRKARSAELGHLFVSLLRDKSRWVQMAAYETLGQFISTFADPDVSGFELDEEGHLIPFRKTTSSGEPSNSEVLTAHNDQRSQDAFCSAEQVENSSCIGIDMAPAPPELNFPVSASLPDDSSSLKESVGNLRHPETRTKFEERTLNDLGSKEEFNTFQFWRTPVKDIDVDDDRSSCTSHLQVTDKVRRKMLDETSSPLFAVSEFERSDDVTLFSRLSQSSPSDLELQDDLVDIALEDGNLASQDVVPVALLEHYVSMTEPDKAQTIDSELPRQCAFAFPGVVLALGKDNWHCLKDTYEKLASDMQVNWKVRRTLAFSIHDLALILGEDITVADLMPIFNSFLKDLDEVRVGVLKHLYDFIHLLPVDLQNDYLQVFGEFLTPDNNRNWRFRKDLAEQLILLSELYDAQEISEFFCPIAFELVRDKVADVRITAFQLLAVLLQRLRSGGEASVLKKFVTDIVGLCTHHQPWVRRKSCAQICLLMLEEKVEEDKQYAVDFLPCIVLLASDPVPNVRLIAAKALQLFSEMDYFKSLSEEEPIVSQVLGTLDRLKVDEDRDVRFFAGGKDFDDNVVLIEEVIITEEETYQSSGPRGGDQSPLRYKMFDDSGEDGRSDQSEYDEHGNFTSASSSRTHKVEYLSLCNEEGEIGQDVFETGDIIVEEIIEEIIEQIGEL